MAIVSFDCGSSLFEMLGLVLIVVDHFSCQHRSRHLYSLSLVSWWSVGLWQISDVEAEYLNAEFSQAGTVLKGFDGFLSSKETLRKRVRVWKPEDRIFSLSSKSSPVVSAGCSRSIYTQCCLLGRHVEGAHDLLILGCNST
jgi:chromatin modification-related protein EAF6